MGEIALATDGVRAGVQVWMNHPDGVVAGVTVVVYEADAAWLSNPEQSYRIVSVALERLHANRAVAKSSELQSAVARLEARSRKNAARP